ncbi:hypothetical protein BH09ACT1_BH09ACT1_21970 [soil metagenome]
MASPSASTAPVAARIQINGDSLTILDAQGESLETVLYDSDPQSAIDLITNLLGVQPAHVASDPDDFCLGDRVNWGEALTIRYFADASVESGGISVISRARTIGMVTVGAPNDFGVGDPSSALQSGIPGATLNDDGAGGTIVWWGVNSSGVGAAAKSETSLGAVVYIAAPVFPNTDC